MDPFDKTVIELSELEALAAKAANYERLELILRGYFAQHAENRDEDLGCPCRWCLEARAFLSG